MKEDPKPIELDTGNELGGFRAQKPKKDPLSEGFYESSGRDRGARGVGSSGNRMPVDFKRPSVLRRAMRRVWTYARRALLVGTGLAVGGLIGLFFYVRSVEAELPAVTDLKSTYKPAQVTRVLARDGTVLAELFTERRTLVAIETLPPHVKLAVLGAEDATFYEHEGLNYLGILRALVVNLRSGHVRQGGSTITQQVVKNILLDSERSLKRKIREALLARRLEQELSKDQILEIYLNHIYFGHGRYGIEEASRDTFGKNAKDLSIGEASLLAGIIACPETCGPRRDMKKALERRGIALSRMLQKQFLSQTQYDAALAEPVRLVAVVEAESELAPEAVTIAKRMLHELEPERAALGGFTITTTIDPKMQAAARKSVRENLAAYDKRHGLTGALKGLAAPPPPPKDPKKGAALKALPKAKDPAFEGIPNYDHHRVYVGVVEAVDNATGMVDVRVGTVLGSFRLADFERYNPQKLQASAFAPLGAHVRVTLLAAVPVAAAMGVVGVADATSATQAPDPNSVHDAKVSNSPFGKVPLRLESGPEGAFVVLDVRTRAVLALVGNYEATSGGLDRATQARRQPGSTFKPVVYSFALHSHRFTPASLIDVTPSAFGDYKPTNYEGWTAKDPLRLREVLANSVNIGAVRVLEDVGPQNVVSWAQSLGVTTPLKPDLSLALGSYEMEPLELAGVYATFAGGGVYAAPRIVSRIVGPDGKDVELKALAPSRRVLEESEAYLMTNMLTSVVDHGTATRAKALGRPVAGKTGTSNQSKDTWFAGYSTDYVAVSWVGYDDGKPLGGGEAGGVTALPAWVAFMKTAHEGRPPAEFPRPAGLVNVKIDTKTGKLPYEDDTDVMDEVFLTGTEPTDLSERPTLDAGLDSGNIPANSPGNTPVTSPGGGDKNEPGLPDLPPPRVP